MGLTVDPGVNSGEAERLVPVVFRIDQLRGGARNFRKFRDRKCAFSIPFSARKTDPGRGLVRPRPSAGLRLLEDRRGELTGAGGAIGEDVVDFGDVFHRAGYPGGNRS